MSSSEKFIVLTCNDDVTFKVEEAVAFQSKSIKYFVEEDCTDNIRVPIIKSQIMSKVIEYCKVHADMKKKDDDDYLKSFDSEFVKVDQQTLYALIVAADFLNIESLHNLACETVVEMMKDKTPEEILKIFHFKIDFTPEEEAQICMDRI